MSYRHQVCYKIIFIEECLINGERSREETGPVNIKQLYLAIHQNVNGVKIRYLHECLVSLDT